MLAELHNEYLRHLSILIKANVFDHNLHIKKVDSNISIIQVLQALGFEENQNLLLQHNANEIELQNVMEFLTLMLSALETIFLKEKRKVYRESMIFLTIFFLRVILELGKVNGEKFAYGTELNGLFVMFANILEAPENVFDRNEYSSLATQKTILIKEIKDLNGENILNKDRLAFHINRKNNKSDSFNGQLIYHKESLIFLRADPEVVSLALAQPLRDISNGLQGRTQFFVYLEGQGNHLVILDVQKSDSTLQCICIETAENESQIVFLEHLEKFFTKEHIQFDTIASATSLQKDTNSCAILGFALASIVSKLEFAQLKKQSTAGAKGIFWFSPSALGLKAILMAQSTTHMNQLYKETNQPPIILDLWTALYGFKLGKDANAYSYVHHRNSGLARKESTEALLNDNNSSKQNPAPELRSYARSMQS